MANKRHFTVEIEVPVVIRPVKRGGAEGVTVRGLGDTGGPGFRISGLECKIHQLKLRPADAMMFFLLFQAEIRTSADAMTLVCSSLDVEPKFEHLRKL